MYVQMPKEQYSKLFWMVHLSIRTLANSPPTAREQSKTQKSEQKKCKRENFQRKNICITLQVLLHTQIFLYTYEHINMAVCNVEIEQVTSWKFWENQVDFWAGERIAEVTMKICLCDGKVKLGS